MASIGYFPSEPSRYSTVQFYDASSDPANVGIASWSWDFGDGASTNDTSPIHQFAADGDYPVELTVTTWDGRSSSITQTVRVRTHDLAITKIITPNSANVGQTKLISVAIRNTAYPETVQVDLYKSTPGGFVWVATITKSVPALACQPNNGLQLQLYVHE